MLILFYLELRSIKGEYSNQIKIIEAVDDINIDLLEVRRYEKNMLLFRDETANIDKYHQYISRLKKEANNLKNEITSLLGENVYTEIISNISIYESSFNDLNLNFEQKLKLLSTIRLNGREIEHNSIDKMAVFDIRRKEKNYLLYKEPNLIDELTIITSSLKSKEPLLSSYLDEYMKNINEYVSLESTQMEILKKMRLSAREIEERLNRFSVSKRSLLNVALARSEIFFIATSFLIIAITILIGMMFSRKIVKDLKEIDRSLDCIIKDDHSFRELTIHDSMEIESFNENYNKKLRKIKKTNIETHKLIDKLGELNNVYVKKQNEIIETRKTEAMKLFASEICHEINNPLSSILSFLGIMYEELRDEDSNKDIVRIMLKETNRCHMLVHKLSAYAKDSTLNLREINIITIVNDAVRIQSSFAEIKSVSLFLHNTDTQRKCTVDTALINQVFINIITNAIKFSKEDDWIYICITDAEGGVNISIKDEGIGIPRDKLSLIFKPFFSTQKESGGTGLGLALAKKIVERHGGMISVESVVNEGSTFTVFLPTVEMSS
jgi:signal transduction histidine kinase